MANISQAYQFLPRKRKDFTKEKIIIEMLKNIKELNLEEEVQNRQLQLCLNITTKLAKNDWTLEDYFTFSQVVNQNIIRQYSKETLPIIINLFSYTEEELKRALDNIAYNSKDMKVPLYPYSELVKTEDGKQVATVLPYNKIDPYKMAVTLFSKMHGLIGEDVRKLSQEKNDELIIELLKDIINNEKDTTPYLTNYDNNFGFLMGLEPYRNIYLSCRETYMRELLKNFQMVYGNKKTIEVYKSLEYEFNRAIDCKCGNVPKVGGYFKYLRKK